MDDGALALISTFLFLFFLTAVDPSPGPPLNKSTHEGVSRASPLCQAMRALEAKLNKLITRSSNWATHAKKQERAEAGAEKQWLKGATKSQSQWPDTRGKGTRLGKV